MIVLDKDIITDTDVFDDQIVKIIREMTEWLVKQVSILIRQHRVELLQKKPRAVFGAHLRVVYTCMIRCVDTFRRGSKLDEVYSLRAKFNDALNNAAARSNQYILTINSCCTSAHFDQWGNLSQKGKEAFWAEMDDLLERFDRDQIKLLPTPLRGSPTQFGKRLPTPPPK